MQTNKSVLVRRRRAVAFKKRISVSTDVKSVNVSVKQGDPGQNDESTSKHVGPPGPQFSQRAGGYEGTSNACCVGEIER